MKAIKCNKAYLGTKEVTQGSISAGDSSIGLLYTSIFRKLGDYQTGDAVVWDTQKKLFKVTPPENINQLDTERYIPTGVIAIPSSHDVYGTGEAGVIALKSASLTTPGTGQVSYVCMCYGAFGTDYLELNNYNQVASMGTMNENIQEQVTTLKNSGYMPLMRSLSNAKFPCPHDSTALYVNLSSSSYGYIPSPYLEGGLRNPAYYQTESPSSPANALSDFAGKTNTEFLCSKATTQTDWKTTTITNKFRDGYHPAACSCWRYHTAGTSQGDWFLPACGELGYCAARYDKINEVIKELQTHFETVLFQLIADAYLSSSESNSSESCLISLKDGQVFSSARFNSYHVRPFTRLK